MAAAAWGHTAGPARTASDAYAAAAFAVDGETFFIARDPRDGRALGCAAITIRDGLATLGGMATLPAERRRGVQAALVAHRRRFAADHGCDLVVTSTGSGGASERNLRRLGFRPAYQKEIRRRG